MPSPICRLPASPWRGADQAPLPACSEQRSRASCRSRKRRSIRSRRAADLPHTTSTQAGHTTTVRRSPTHRQQRSTNCTSRSGCVRTQCVERGSLGGMNEHEQEAFRRSRSDTRASIWLTKRRGLVRLLRNLAWTKGKQALCATQPATQTVAGGPECPGSPATPRFQYPAGAPDGLGVGSAQFEGRRRPRRVSSVRRDTVTVASRPPDLGRRRSQRKSRCTFRGRSGRRDAAHPACRLQRHRVRRPH